MEWQGSKQRKGQTKDFSKTMYLEQYFSYSEMDEKILEFSSRPTKKKINSHIHIPTSGESSHLPRMAPEKFLMEAKI